MKSREERITRIEQIWVNTTNTEMFGELNDEIACRLIAKVGNSVGMGWSLHTDDLLEMLEDSIQFIQRKSDSKSETRIELERSYDERG
jgi:hypothetical protein